MPSRYFGLVTAAGTGARLGGDVPKQYRVVGRRPMLAHAVEALTVRTPLTRVYVAHAPNDKRCADVITAGFRIELLACGGSTRAETVRNALSALSAELNNDDWLLVHDASRPCLPKDALRRLIYEVGDDAVGGVLAVPTTDTDGLSASEVGRAFFGYARESKWLVQAPQMFRCKVLWEAYKRPDALLAMDEAQAVEQMGLRFRVVLGSSDNINVVTADDLVRAESILAGKG